MVQWLANGALHTAPRGLYSLSDCDEAAHVTRVYTATSRRRKTHATLNISFRRESNVRTFHAYSRTTGRCMSL